MKIKKGQCKILLMNLQLNLILENFIVNKWISNFQTPLLQVLLKISVDLSSHFRISIIFDMFCHSYDWTSIVSISIEPRDEISNNVVCATSKGSDQPAHMRSPIRAFASRLNIL